MKDKPTKWGIKVFTLSDATNDTCAVELFGLKEKNSTGFDHHKECEGKQGYIDYRLNGPLLAVVWFDRRNV